MWIPTSTHAADHKATALLHQAIQAQGGEQALRSLKSVQWEAFGYRNELEESERPEDGSYFYPQTVTELTDAVTREHLNVEQFFMMHIGPTSWVNLAKAVAAAEAQDTPNGVL